MRFSQFFETGPTRIPIPSSYYLASIIGLLYSQTLLAAVKPMSTNVKRVLATPLIFANLILPVLYRDASDTWNLLGATIPFMAFLRYFDLFWIAPAVQGRDAYTSMKYLHVEFWSCLRTFPKSKEEEKEFVKDCKFYHILPNLFFHAFIADMIGAWFMTFTQDELMNMYFTRPSFFIGFFLMTLIAMNSGFTVNGYLMQLIYVLLYERGSYCSKQWRRLMENPICATSLSDIWSFRWHQSLKPTWLHLPFTEVRCLVERVCTKLHIKKNAKRISIMVAALSVFMCSGILHEYLAYVNIGYTEYKLFAGQEMCFFTIQGIAVMFEKLLLLVLCSSKNRSSWTIKYPLLITTIQRIWTLGILCITSPLFLQAFMHWDAWHTGAFMPSLQIYAIDILRVIPGAHYICGSLLSG